jgi:hypothetical protein
MKKIDERNRPQPSKKLELRLETLRRLATAELTSARGGAAESGDGWPTITRGDI